MAKRYEPIHDNEFYFVDHQTTYSLIEQYLIDKGVAQTRATPIANLIKDAFKAVTALDDRNSHLVFHELPELFRLAKLYTNIYGEEGFEFEKFLQEERND